MDRCKEEVLSAVENRFRAVAVVGVEVPDRDAGGPKPTLGNQGGDRDLVEVAEAHRAIVGRVMAGRAHQRKDGRGGALVEGVLRGFDGGGDRPAGVFADAGEPRGIGVEVPSCLQGAHKGIDVGELEHGVRRGARARFAPEPTGLRPAKVIDRAEDAGGLLGALGGAVLGAARIVEQEHRTAR